MMEETPAIPERTSGCIYVGRMSITPPVVDFIQCLANQNTSSQGMWLLSVLVILIRAGSMRAGSGVTSLSLPLYLCLYRAMLCENTDWHFLVRCVVDIFSRWGLWGNIKRAPKSCQATSTGWDCTTDSGPSDLTVWPRLSHNHPCPNNVRVLCPYRDADKWHISPWTLEFLTDLFLFFIFFMFASSLPICLWRKEVFFNEKIWLMSCKKVLKNSARIHDMLIQPTISIELF